MMSAEVELKKFLSEKTVRGKWKEVVEKYREDPHEAQRVAVNESGDRALHVAVNDNQEEIVETLVELIKTSKLSKDYKQVLEITNESKNNALHLAAAIGNLKMCQVIASAHEDLVDMRNEMAETPLFLAAAYGHKDAFYCLYYFCRSDLTRASTNCREKFNGDTVLHCALRNDHFDLAFQLINMNKDAVHWKTKEGTTPLHVLASKPASFRSGAHISGWRNIIYSWTFVDKLKPQSIETLSELSRTKKVLNAKKTHWSFPRNYETCMNIFIWLGHAVSTLFYPLLKKKNDKDLEKCVEEENHVNFDRTNEYEERLNNTASNPWMAKFFKIVFSTIMIILELGFPEIKKIREKKQKHTWLIQVMERLIHEFAVSSDQYGNDGQNPMGSSKVELGRDDGTTLPYNVDLEKITYNNNNVKFSDKPKNPKLDVTERSVMILAARNGVIEIVSGMFERFPLSIRDVREPDKKNVVLLAAQHRQSDVYQFLLNKKYHLQSLFRAVDSDGNSALHLAATISTDKPWHISGAALEMQWEVEWYKIVKKSVPLHLFAMYNKEGKTASRIFENTHTDLVKNGKDWLYKASQSCSVVSALVATVAFATAATIPGGNNQHGGAILEKERGFFIFVISSLIALSLSTTSVIMFLAILTSRFEIEDYFGSMLPWKLLTGLSSLYFSIIAMLISFCTGHYFLIPQRLQNIAVLLYTLTFLPVALIFAIVHLPLYFDLMLVLFKAAPRRRSVDLDLCD